MLSISLSVRSSCPLSLYLFWHVLNPLQIWETFRIFSDSLFYFFFVALQRLFVNLLLEQCFARLENWKRKKNNIHHEHAYPLNSPDQLNHCLLQTNNQIATPLGVRVCSVWWINFSQPGYATYQILYRANELTMINCVQCQLSAQETIFGKNMAHGDCEFVIFSVHGWWSNRSNLLLILIYFRWATSHSASHSEYTHDSSNSNVIPYSITFIFSGKQTRTKLRFNQTNPTITQKIPRYRIIHCIRFSTKIQRI